MSTVLKRVVGVVVPSILLLGGCGIAETQFNPGVAARVGDETITNDEVDDLAARYCSAVEKQIREGGQKFPLAGFKMGIAAQLALQSAAEQIAEGYGVTPGPDYRAQLAQIEQQAEVYTGDAREAYIEVQATQPRFVDLLTQVGKIELANEGQPDASIDFQQARGQDELAEWAAREGITFDPRYGLEVVEGAPQPVDTDLSYAFGDVAKDGKAEGDPTPAYVGSLPANATCG